MIGALQVPMVKMMKSNYDSMTEDEILEYLLKKYKDDDEAVDYITSVKDTDLPYLRSSPNKSTPRQHLLQLIAHLETWH